MNNQDLSLPDRADIKAIPELFITFQNYCWRHAELDDTAILMEIANSCEDVSISAHALNIVATRKQKEFDALTNRLAALTVQNSVTVATDEQRADSEAQGFKNRFPGIPDETALWMVVCNGSTNAIKSAALRKVMPE